VNEMFVVRVWQPAASETPEEGLHGLVLHVPSRRERPFRNADELVAEIRDCLALTASDERHAGVAV
jgi:hypothetical protein